MPVKYDLRVLEYVLAIAREGSVSAAARHLNVTQPTISRQLRELEKRLGTQLFERGRRGLTLTAAGNAFAGRATRVLAEADSVLDDVRRAERGLAGRITIGFTGSAINGPLGNALARIRRVLAGVELNLVESFDDADLTAGLIDKRYDVAVQRLPGHDVRLSSRLWVQEPLSLFVPQKHPLAKRRPPVDVEILESIPLIIWPRDSSARAYDEVISICQHAGVVPRIAAEARTVQTMLALVAAGFGGAVMTDSYSVLKRDGVVALPLARTLTALHLGWRTGDTNPVLPRLMEILVPASE
ncbi:LysR family transcriptional regulator [Mycobacterium sp. LTG2003]